MEAFFNLKEMIRQMKCSAEIQEEQWNVESYASDRNTGTGIREIEFTGRIRFPLQFL